MQKFVNLVVKDIEEILATFNPLKEKLTEEQKEQFETLEQAKSILQQSKMIRITSSASDVAVLAFITFQIIIV